MAEYTCLARAAGARIIGGCCGTSPAHIAAMRKAIDSGAMRQRPTFEAVEASLGPIVRGTSGAGFPLAHRSSQQSVRKSLYCHKSFIS